VFDYDHSGNVSTEELINTIRALNMESQVAEILAVISGSGHTGNIDFTAFLEIFSVNGDGNLENCFTSIF
jgi:Ca2+-binding EF-hand superfamily protein